MGRASSAAAIGPGGTGRRSGRRSPLRHRNRASARGASRPFAVSVRGYSRSDNHDRSIPALPRPRLAFALLGYRRRSGCRSRGQSRRCGDGCGQMGLIAKPNPQAWSALSSFQRVWTSFGSALPRGRGCGGGSGDSGLVVARAGRTRAVQPVHAGSPRKRSTGARRNTGGVRSTRGSPLDIFRAIAHPRRCARTGKAVERVSHSICGGGGHVRAFLCRCRHVAGRHRRARRAATSAAQGVDSASDSARVLGVRRCADRRLLPSAGATAHRGGAGCAGWTAPKALGMACSSSRRLARDSGGRGRGAVGPD